MNFSLSFSTALTSSQELKIAILIDTGSRDQWEEKKELFSIGISGFGSEEQRPPRDYWGSLHPRDHQWERVGHDSHPRGVLFGQYATFKNIPIFFSPPTQNIRKMSKFPLSLIIESCAMLGPLSSWHHLTGPSLPPAGVTWPAGAAQSVTPALPRQ